MNVYRCLRVCTRAPWSSSSLMFDAWVRGQCRIGLLGRRHHVCPRGHLTACPHSGKACLCLLSEQMGHVWFGPPETNPPMFLGGPLICVSNFHRSRRAWSADWMCITDVDRPLRLRRPPSSGHHSHAGGHVDCASQPARSVRSVQGAARSGPPRTACPLSMFAGHAWSSRAGRAAVTRLGHLLSVSLGRRSGES